VEEKLEGQDSRAEGALRFWQMASQRWRAQGAGPWGFYLEGDGGTLEGFEERSDVNFSTFYFEKFQTYGEVGRKYKDQIYTFHPDSLVITILPHMLPPHTHFAELVKKLQTL